MSNSVVGCTYAQIIEKVIEAAKNDFEESGVHQDTLLELKKTWEKKLSKQRTAQLPWDPPPPRQQQPQQQQQKQQHQQQRQHTPTVPVNPPASFNLSQPQSCQRVASNYGSTCATIDSNDISIPKYDGYNPGLDRGLARQRAINLLHLNYGTQAEASIANVSTQKSGVAFPGQGHPQQQQLQHRAIGLQLPGQEQNQLLRQNSQSSQGSFIKSQVDGSKVEDGDLVTDLAMRRKADSRLMWALLKNNMNFSDSGLMVPLSSSSENKSQRRKIRKLHNPSTVSDIQFSSTKLIIPQVDGENVADEDAINSDLDDSVDEFENEEDDNNNPGDIMLCTYDKVQRVKNKWKCTLKDGVVNTGGKDFLFSKAQGEFEW